MPLRISDFVPEGRNRLDPELQELPLAKSHSRLKPDNATNYLANTFVR
jgi:hypothetical protein